MYVFAKRFLTLAVLVSLPFLSACTLKKQTGEGDSSVGYVANAPGGNGEGIYGNKPKSLVSFKDAQMQCGFTTLNTSGDHQIHCTAYFIGKNGTPVEPDGVEIGTKLFWDELKSLDGTTLQAKRCWEERMGLDYFCKITANPGMVAKVQATMQVLEEATSILRKELAVIFIPFSVGSFGEVPEVAFQLPVVTPPPDVASVAPAADSTSALAVSAPVEESTFDVIKLDPLKTFFPEPLSGCARGKSELYFTSRNFIFRINDEGKAELYAGSASEMKVGGLTHRRKINFGASLYIACTEDSVYVSDTQNGRVVKLTDDGPVVLIAGKGSAGFSGDGELAVNAELSMPTAIALQNDKSLLVIDSGNYRIRKIGVDGIISTFAGNGVKGASGDGGLAINASFTQLTGMLPTPDGGLLVADWGADAVRKIDNKGMIRSFMHGAPSPFGLAYNKWGSVVMSSTGQRAIYPVYDGGTPTNFPLRFMNYPALPGAGLKSLYPMNPLSMFSDQNKWIILIDFANHQIRRYEFGGSEKITVIAGANVSQNPTTEEVESGKLRFRSEGNVAIGKDGSVYVADMPGHRVVRIAPDNKVTNIAGTGRLEWDSIGLRPYGFTPDGKRAKDAYIFSPTALTVDKNDNVFVVDQGNYRIRKINKEGILTTVAGNGGYGFNGYEIYSSYTIATQEPFRRIGGVAVSPDGTLYFSDIETHLIHKVTPAGLKYRVAGNGVYKKGDAAFWVSLFPGPGFSGDGGAAATAYLSSPRGLSVSNDGTLFIADSGNNRIRKISPTGIITTIAGNGFAGFSGDGGPATSARLNHPTSVSWMEDESLLVAEPENKRIRKLTRQPDGTYTISTFVASSESECGTGVVQKKVKDTQVKAAFEKSVALQCVSHPRSVANTGSCPLAGAVGAVGVGGSITVTAYQTFGLKESFYDTLSANVLRYVIPCE